MRLVKWYPNNHRAVNPFYGMNRFFNTSLDNWMNDDVEYTWKPSVDISEDDNSYIVSADLPGLTKKEISINVKDNLLTITGERKSAKKDKDDSYYRMERRYGTFSRSFHLPDEVLEEKITASFKNGVLTIDIPKAEVTKPKEIEIKVA